MEGRLKNVRAENEKQGCLNKKSAVDIKYGAPNNGHAGYTQEGAPNKGHSEYKKTAPGFYRRPRHKNHNDLRTSQVFPPFL